MKNIVILVIASRGEFYDQFVSKYWIHLIKYTNDHYSNIKIYLYCGDIKNQDIYQKILDNTLIFNTIPETLIPGIYHKTIKAFEYVEKNFTYDIIFRTNLSSFLHLDNLNKITKIFNKIKYFLGIHFNRMIQKYLFNFSS